jgi:radical SAM protein with 4Fe4S-binding SPASM domain
MGLKSWLFPAKPERVAPGLYPGRLDVDGQSHRLHLRVEPTGEGVLTLDASRVLHLNATAAEVVKFLLDGYCADETTALMAKRYRVAKDLLARDVQQVLNTVRTLSATDRVCPLTDLGVELVEPYSPHLSAPMRMDLALTYRCQNRCAHCYNEETRQVAELDTAAWRRILDAICKAGVPHVVFTGGEPTLRDDLPGLVAYAEELGLVTGLNTNGRRLGDAKYAASLRDVGLDHAQITLESADPGVHNAMTRSDSFEETLEGIRRSKAAGLYTLTNTTLTRANATGIEDLVDLVAQEGLPTFAVNGMIYSGKGKACGTDLTPQEVVPLLERLAKRSGERGVRLVWYTPTRYCELNPVEMGLGVKQCTAARVSMAVEPDGTVIPCQSYYEGVGNMLTDSWDSIWNHPRCMKLRQPQKPLTECEACEHLTLCGGGCPLATDHERLFCKEVASGA